MKTRLAENRLPDTVGIYAEKKLGLGLCSLHAHDFYELDIIVNGSDGMALNGKSEQVYPGVAVFLSPEDFHSYTSEAPKDIYNIQFTEHAVSADILRELTDRRQRLYRPDGRDFEILCALATLLVYLDLNDTANSAIATRILESILLILSKNATAESASPEIKSEDMQKALIYIHSHFRENPSLSQIASLLPLNERYFCSKFKEYTGQTYKGYLKMMKLRYARRLVLATDLSVNEIAEQSGYATQSHFNREFKARYGVAPLEMRRKPKS